MLSLLSEGSLTLVLVLAYQVLAYLDGFAVQDAVAAAGALPQADGAQLVGSDRGLQAQVAEVLEIAVGDEPGLAAGRGVGGGADLEVVGGPGHHAFPRVRRVAGWDADEPGVPGGLVACGIAAVHACAATSMGLSMAADKTTVPLMMLPGSA